MTTKPFYVGFDTKSWPYSSQLNSPVDDGQITDENNKLNCGPTVVSQVIRKYWGSAPTPDDVKDHVLSQDVTGVTFASQLQSALAYYGDIPTTLSMPTNQAKLLNVEFEALYRKRPVVCLMCWIDDAGTIHPEIGHWRVVTGMSETTVFTSDPWTGKLRTETYAQHFSRSKSVLIVPTISAPSFIARLTRRFGA